MAEPEPIGARKARAEILPLLDIILIVLFIVLAVLGPENYRKFKSRLEGLGQERSELSSKLVLCRENNDRIQDELNSYGDENRRLRSELERADQDNRSLKERLVDMGVALERLNRDYEAEKRQNRQWEDLRQLRGQLQLQAFDKDFEWVCLYLYYDDPKRYHHRWKIVTGEGKTQDLEYLRSGEDLIAGLKKVLPADFRNQKRNYIYLFFWMKDSGIKETRMISEQLQQYDLIFQASSWDGEGDPCQPMIERKANQGPGSEHQP